MITVKFDKRNYLKMTDSFHKTVVSALDEAQDRTVAYNKSFYSKLAVVIAVLALVTVATVVILTNNKNTIRIEPVTDNARTSTVQPDSTTILSAETTTKLTETQTTTENTTTKPQKDVRQSSSANAAQTSVSNGVGADSISSTEQFETPEITEVAILTPTRRSFEEGVVIVRLESNVSGIKKVHTPDEFTGVNIESIVDITYYDDNLLSIDETPENFTQILKIVLADKNDQAVLDAVDLLNTTSGVLNASPNYYDYAASSN